MDDELCYLAFTAKKHVHVTCGKKGSQVVKPGEAPDVEGD